MPTAYIRKLAEEGKGTIADLERKWDEAKAKAEDAGHTDDWPYVTSIFKRLAKIAASTAGGMEMKTTQVIAENAYLESLVDSGHYTQVQVDAAWAKAKQIASDNADDNPDIVPSYAYTTAIFQSLLGIKKAEHASFKLNASARLAASRKVSP